ncbi:Eco57I restriction-modification methylase domain-containing protein [Brachyspira intermedia]|uniref:Eco57I restriction-modification methylase domain-containing protein n=1 Tax=Brachyspira intermedia TaxID=84377 RepID=UPI0030045527
MSLEYLKERWSKDENIFKNKELGGLQDFVKDALQDNELFNLKKGLESTPNQNRKYEFTIETSKEGRRPDYVIFIDGINIVIPVEVEKFENIEKGIEQVFQYQKDWNKKFAILTDGNEWRFYRSNKYKSFYLYDMLSSPKDFLSYWNSYIKEENYYIDLLKIDGEEKSEQLNLNKQENRYIFFDDITQLIINFKGKMKAIGSFNNLLDNSKAEKQAVETSYAYFIQFILYKVLVDNGYKKFNDEYNKMLNKIQKALLDKDFYSIIINEIKNISEYISSNIYKPFAEEQKSINKKLIDNLKGEIDIDDISPWLDIIVFINRYNFSGIKNEIFGFIYENYLKDLYPDKNKGQYFTDPEVVNFMLKEIGYTEDYLKNASDDEISLIDVSCGAGTFLYSAVDRIINAFDDGNLDTSKKIEELIDKNIFGLDIEEFPLYLAEMNILMRMLPLIVNDNYENPIDNKLKIFKTKDSISEFLETGINSHSDEELDLFSHIQKTALDYPSFMRDEKDLEDMLLSLKGNGEPRKRFDFVIGNPPYIGYNECCRQEIEFTKLIKDKNDNSITMSNVYGVNLNTVPNRRKPYSPKPNLYAFFIALGIALLKDNGKLCYIIPQTILTAGDLDVLRYHLSHFTTIEKIISFEGNMFIGRGLKQNKPIATSSLIFILSKKDPSKNNRVSITNYKSYDDIKGIDFHKYLNSKNKNKEYINQDILRKELSNWNFIKQDKIFINMYDIYKSNSYSIEEYRRFVLKNYDEITLDGGLKLIDEKIVSEKINGYKVFNPKINDYKKYKLTDTNLYYDYNNEIIYLPGSQGLKVFNNIYKIVWKTRFNNIFQYSDEKDLILDGNQSLIISSNNNDEILYLFSLLNSKVTLILLKNMLKLPNENMYIVALSSIKEIIRIPKIDNKNIKIKIIELTKKLLSLEDYKIKDFVDFNTSKQKFKNIAVNKNKLILTDINGNIIEQKIKRKSDLVKSVIEEKFSANDEISLNELKFSDCIDKEEQNIIKNYVDDLVFALYFNIDIKELGLSNSEKIKKLCQKNNFYSYIYN